MSTFLKRIGVMLLAVYIFITAYGATRRWIDTGSPIYHGCSNVQR